MPNTPSILKALIVGCGNIAGGFDMSSEKLQSLPCTHAGAYQQDKRFILSACVDPDTKKRKLFQKYWDIKYDFENLSDAAKEKLKIDIVSICSPILQHKENIETAIKLKPKLIFCEKPICLSITDTKEIIKKCKQENILFAVNYTRRWDPTIQQLRSDINNSTYGELRSIVGYYNKGVFNNGSHLINTLQYLLGDIAIQNIISYKYDFFSHDPSVSCALMAKNTIPIHLVNGHAEDFSLVELQFIFSSGILTMEQGGLSWSWRKVEDSQRFIGYKNLGSYITKKGEYEKAMLCALDNIYQSIFYNEQLINNGENSLSTQLLCEELLTYTNNHESTPLPSAEVMNESR